jgi:hypothetical protein
MYQYFDDGDLAIDVFTLNEVVASTRYFRDMQTRSGVIG